MEFSKTEWFWIGVAVGLVLAVGLSFVIHAVAGFLVVAAIAFIVFIVSKRWIGNKFRIGL